MIDLHCNSMHYTLGSSRIDVLREVTLHIPRGQGETISGYSGSGKTSLLLLPAGLLLTGTATAVDVCTASLCLGSAWLLRQLRFSPARLLRTDG